MVLGVLSHYPYPVNFSVKFTLVARMDLDGLVEFDPTLLVWFGDRPIHSGFGRVSQSSGNGTFRVDSLDHCSGRVEFWDHIRRVELLKVFCRSRGRGEEGA